MPWVACVVAVALFGGNCNNGAYCSADYLNLNNSANNANSNIGASDFFSYQSVSPNAVYIPRHKAKIIPDVGSVE